MDKIRSAFRRLESAVSKIYENQECAANRACQLLLWREVERQIDTCMELRPASRALSELEQYVAEYVCRLAEDAFWLELGTPTRTVLAWTDGSAYLHENTPAVLQDIVVAGAGPKGRWLYLDNLFTEKTRALLAETIRKLAADACAES